MRNSLLRSYRNFVSTMRDELIRRREFKSKSPIDADACINDQVPLRSTHFAHRTLQVWYERNVNLEKSLTYMSTIVFMYWLKVRLSPPPPIIHKELLSDDRDYTMIPIVPLRRFQSVNKLVAETLEKNQKAEPKNGVLVVYGLTYSFFRGGYLIPYVCAEAADLAHRSPPPPPPPRGHNPRDIACNHG
ncbi:uncharacterized protein [Euphorbia lathyris]|uniref:uncharacterized protein n=1 Tax=Euphorbia lathyris TaxID=212925 RepID=UPI00331414BF